MEKEGPVVTFTRENQSAMVLDADQDMIHFENYDSFFMPSWSDMMNGSVHDIDEGVEPDIYIAKPASFFDREALSEFINSTL
jgi:hypothetical protein